MPLQMNLRIANLLEVFTHRNWRNRRWPRSRLS